MVINKTFKFIINVNKIWAIDNLYIIYVSLTINKSGFIIDFIVFYLFKYYMISFIIYKY